VTELARAAVYVLCMLTSAACAFLLVRAWRRTRTELLLWTAACFVLLALNNVLLVVDLLVFPDNDLSLARQLTALGAVGVLLYGFVREAA
jgi:drug/metabolite transporter (DMT)-like permease